MNIAQSIQEKEDWVWLLIYMRCILGMMQMLYILMLDMV